MLNFISTRTFLLLFFDYTLHITHLALLVILSLSIMCLNKTSESSEESKIIRLVPCLAISISSATADKHIYIGLLFLPLITITPVRHENSAEIKRFLFKSTLLSLFFFETKNFHLCTSSCYRHPELLDLNFVINSARRKNFCVLFSLWQLCR